MAPKPFGDRTAFEGRILLISKQFDSLSEGLAGSGSTLHRRGGSEGAPAPVRMAQAISGLARQPSAGLQVSNSVGMAGDARASFGPSALGYSPPRLTASRVRPLSVGCGPAARNRSGRSRQSLVSPRERTAGGAASPARCRPSTQGRPAWPSPVAKGRPVHEFDAERFAGRVGRTWIRRRAGSAQSPASLCADGPRCGGTSRDCAQ